MAFGRGRGSGPGPSRGSNGLPAKDCWTGSPVRHRRNGRPWPNRRYASHLYHLPYVTSKGGFGVRPTSMSNTHLPFGVGGRRVFIAAFGVPFYAAPQCEDDKAARRHCKRCISTD